MYFKDFVAVLLRRWRVVLVGAVITVMAGAGAIFLVPTNYQATGQMLLLLPPQAAGSTPINPYLNLDPGLTIAASLIAATVSSEATQKEMEAAGFTSKYSIALNPGTGPLLEISTEDTDPHMAIGTRDELMRRLDIELDRIQLEENVPKRQLIHARRNNVSGMADAVPGSKIRALAAVGALGVVSTFIIAFLIDRRPQRAGKKKGAPVAWSEGEGEDEGEAWPSDAGVDAWADGDGSSWPSESAVDDDSDLPVSPDADTASNEVVEAGDTARPGTTADSTGESASISQPSSRSAD